MTNWADSGLQLDSDFHRARRPDGSAVDFTRAERALLEALARHPGHLRTRQQLLDAISGPGSDSSDRNIDFLVNRLRRKLQDSARAPRYIETRHGEGYSWIGHNQAPALKTQQATLVVGPLRGQSLTPEATVALTRIGQELATALDNQMPGQGRVVFDADCPSPQAFPDSAPSYALSCDGFILDDEVHCAMTLQRFRAGVPLWVQGASAAAAQSRMAGIAEDILTALLRAESREDQPPTPDLEPLPIRMYHAMALLAEANDFTQYAGRLRQNHQADPDDPVARLMLATNLHSELFLGGHTRFLSDARSPTGLCDEIESLLLPAVPGIVDNPVYALAAAKLLYFLDRGQNALALDMAEAALRNSGAFAAASVTVGQLRCFEGDIEGGESLLDAGLALAEPESRFVSYFGVIKLQAALAMADPDRVASAVESLGAFSAELAAALEIHYADCHPNGPSAALLARLEKVDAPYATAVLRHMHAVTGRLYKYEWMRANYLGPTFRLLAARLGPDFLPADIAADVPSLLENWRARG